MKTKVLLSALLIAFFAAGSAYATTSTPPPSPPPGSKTDHLLCYKNKAFKDKSNRLRSRSKPGPTLLAVQLAGGLAD